MATHSSVLAWRIPGTGEPGGLQSMGSHRVGQDWSNLVAAVAAGRQRVPNKMNPNRRSPRYIMIRMEKVEDKDRILKAAREKQRVTYREPTKGCQLIFLQQLCRPEANMIYLKCWKGKKKMKPRILYSERL